LELGGKTKKNRNSSITKLTGPAISHSKCKGGKIFNWERGGKYGEKMI